MTSPSPRAVGGEIHREVAAEARAPAGPAWARGVQGTLGPRLPRLGPHSSPRCQQSPRRGVGTVSTAHSRPGVSLLPYSWASTPLALRAGSRQPHRPTGHRPSAPGWGTETGNRGGPTALGCGGLAAGIRTCRGSAGALCTSQVDRVAAPSAGPPLTRQSSAPALRWLFLKPQALTVTGRQTQKGGTGLTLDPTHCPHGAEPAASGTSTMACSSCQVRGPLGPLTGAPGTVQARCLRYVLRSGSEVSSRAVRSEAASWVWPGQKRVTVTCPRAGDGSGSLESQVSLCD